MNTSIIKSVDILSAEDAVNIKGGVNDQICGTPNKCICDCWIGNTNNQPPKK